MDLHISDLDATVSRDRAAELLHCHPVYVQQLCKQGDIRGRKVPARGAAYGIWVDIETIDLVMIAAAARTRYLGRHGGKRLAAPEEILAALPLRCDGCGILVEEPGLCPDCRLFAESGQFRHYEEEE